MQVGEPAAAPLDTIAGEVVVEQRHLQLVLRAGTMASSSSERPRSTPARRREDEVGKGRWALGWGLVGSEGPG